MSAWKLVSTLLALLLGANASSSAFITPTGIGARRIAQTKTSRPHHNDGIIHHRLPTTRLNNAVVSGRNLAVAGRIPWKKFLITKTQALKVYTIMKAETHPLDIAVVGFLSVFTPTIGRFLYNNFFYRFRDKVDYGESITSKVANTLCEASRLAVICYFIDTAEIAMEVAGIKGRKMDVSTLIAKLIYATWACFKARLYKRDFFEAVVDRTPVQRKGKQGMVEFVDKISDFLIFGVLGLIWVDILKIKRGTGLSSIFALGGAGTFTITLASQDLARRALNGLALAAADTFHVGDSILLGDGTSGIVTRVGWLDTEIRGTDELVTKIPNSQLSNIRVSNRSRMKFSQVKQNLRFRYQDIDKIPELIDEIRNEISTSCPKVVTDGSRVFRVRWVDFGDDSIEVLVDCRLRNPPQGEKYYEARQGILMAIARAVKRKGVEFALPTVEEWQRAAPQKKK